MVFTNKASVSQETANNNGKNSNSNKFLFAPQAGLLIGGCGFLSNRADYSALVNRTLDINLIRSGNFYLSFKTTEKNLFGGEQREKNELLRIQYFMDFADFSYRTPIGFAGIMFDHICYNTINMNNVDERKLRWYGVGVKLESEGMKIGNRNTGNNAGNGRNIWLPNIINYMFYAGKSLNTEYFNYNYIVSGTIRFDMFRFFNAVTYLEGSVTALIDDEMRFNRASEYGFRINAFSVDITQYFRYEYNHDIETYKGPSCGFWMIGLAMEASVGDNKYGPHYSSTMKLDAPEMHFSANYGRYTSSGLFAFHTDFELEIDLLKLKDFTLFFNSNLSHDSKKTGNGMYPWYLSYIVEYGISFNMDSLHHIMYTLHHYERRDQGNEYDGITEKFHVIAAGLMSRGMKTGFEDSHPAFRIPGSGGFNWEICAGQIIHEINYSYDWEINLKFRLDIARISIITPYILPGTHLIAGKKTDIEYEGEAGLRMKFGLNIIPFYRYQNRINIDRTGGLMDKNHMFGIRVLK